MYSLDLTNICRNWVERPSMITSRKQFAVCTHESRIYAVSKIILIYVKYLKLILKQTTI